MEKYIGRSLEVIYMDKKKHFSHRRIKIRSVNGEFIEAICLASNQFRKFRISNILSYQVITHAK
ncbi:hypothetical protein ASF12_22960 [Paenibacillus sp. Leaf72]|nr:hypothetical protein ASF12_22960 [Paenibacillus sp. Leaf72]